MAKYQLLLPKMGESVAEATIIKWLKKPGDYVEADEAVMEIATDKVDSEVPSPVAGKLAEQLCTEDDVVQVGSVIAIIETEAAEEPAKPEAPIAPAPSEIQQPVSTETYKAPDAAVATPEPVIAIPGIEQLPKAEPVQNTVALNDSIRFYSPLVRSIAVQEGIGAAELDQVSGTGAEGRLTKDDLLQYIKNRSTNNGHAQYTQPSQQTAAPANPNPAYEPKPEPVKAAVSVSGGDEIIEMDRMRRLIADHMVMSKQTSPHVTSFVEADVTNLVLWREKIKNSFEKREGQKITFTPIFIEAVARAIKEMPMINVSVNGTQIIKKKNINISMATALPNGNLIVPVIKQADELNLIGLTKAVNDLANRARNGKLLPDDVKDGTFTITNVGSFGNVMGTPIINQPQVAILAVGAIKKKPAVIETKEGDMIAIRHMMFLSLSYDHRVVDGALGGSFVRKVADYLENWDLNRDI
ncbi:2-oxoglutarate dehydrogenase E2 component (dihydrolipoamide succinyltransferase) [Mucilaginibacter mallensis]|uniref:Dihydrolipoamide acetyltransferase component of pyruvate dehydrogenase complex n=1 Tax=Mucilaginibacter mallensis TaxID=652787 RepID=A0A1H1WIL6_MUCMA|nr:dihydrolipoamide acetyltransferase family protein [Mucilaginibacter mallensis]SDS96039.1 2-oxoglutarate dehydrogenase E2 component (dihydrolipoamide succinyltransferase) [Mucilaginibacter mallensis]